MRVPSGVLFLFGLSLLLLVLTCAVAVAPARALPEQVGARLDGRRGDLVFVALCAVLLSLVVTVLAILASG